MPIPFESLVELLTIATNPWGFSNWYSATAPTEDSCQRIAQELGFPLPPLFVALAKECPSYGGWFCSIGGDYESGMHILNMNRMWRDLNYVDNPLAIHFVLLNHGHDGDCDCWDIRQPQGNGEYPIVYVDADSQGTIGHQWISFEEYVENFVTNGAGRHHDNALRQRAHVLLEAAGISVPPLKR